MEQSGWNRLPYLSRTNVGVSPLDHTPLLPLSFSLSTPQGSKHAEDASCAQTLGVSLALSKNAVLSPRLSCLPPSFHSPSIAGGVVKEGDELYAVAGQKVHGLTIGQLATLVLGPEGSTVDLDLKRGERFLKVCALRPCLISSMLRVGSARTGLSDFA